MKRETRQEQIHSLAVRLGGLVRRLGPLPPGVYVTFVVDDEHSGNFTVGSHRGQRETVAMFRDVIRSSEMLAAACSKGPPS
jgi:hypothetical protein